MGDDPFDDAIRRLIDFYAGHWLDDEAIGELAGELRRLFDQHTADRDDDDG